MISRENKRRKSLFVCGNTRRLILIGISLTLLFLGFGCADRYYVPGQIPINRTDKANQAFYISKNVSVVNACPSDKVSLGKYVHNWNADLRLWTESAVDLLKAELRKANAVKEPDEKTLALTIRSANLFWESRVMNSTVVLHVKAGNGFEKECEVTGASQSLYASCDNAITMAVACVLDDPEIRIYLAPKDSDSDGVFDVNDQCPDTPAGVKVEQSGCPPVSTPETEPQVETRPPTISLSSAPEEERPHFADILFDFNKHNIRPEFHPVLDRLVDHMKRNPSLKLEVQGHADQTGTERYNLGLSERRAMEVCRYLAAREISMDRLLPAGYGYSKPQSAQRTPEGDALNRRVVLIPLDAVQ